MDRDLNNKRLTDLELDNVSGGSDRANAELAQLLGLTYDKNDTGTLEEALRSYMVDAHLVSGMDLNLSLDVLGEEISFNEVKRRIEEKKGKV